jgi:serine/threonine protein kinase
MVDFSHICPNCCKETGDGGGYCPVCGIDAASIKNEEFCIPAGSVLLDRYYIGKVIGQGGFGITYVGYDTKLKTKIALKEYFPHGYAFREIHKEKHTVYSLSGEKTDFYNRGIEKFIAEAQRLAQFSGAPGIVNVRDYFNENNTAYIVMEFVEGEPLAALLEKRERLSESEVTEIFLPILKTLQKVHSAGILHRDIAPDNIMVEPDGTARLIDFGASAEVDENAATSAAVIKHFYVPEEQYDNNRRRQGPWTDVYAISATIFRALEGQTLPDAIERLRGMAFEGFTVTVSAPVKKAVLNGLELFQKDRAQNVDELIAAFSVPAGTAVYKKPKAPKVPKTVAFEAEKPKTSTKKLAAIIGGIAATLAVICLVIFLPRASVPTVEETVTSGITAAMTTASPLITGTFGDWEYTIDTNKNGDVKDYDYYVTIGIGPGKYTGNLKDGKPEGKGVYTASGGSYDGEWKNGLPNGFGIIVENDENRNTYEGEWKDGFKNGKGTEYEYVPFGDVYLKEGKNCILSVEYVNGLWIPNSTIELLTYENTGAIRTEYITIAPSGDHWLGDGEEDPLTIRHNKRVNPDGSIEEWDEVIVDGDYEVINEKYTDPPQS